MSSNKAADGTISRQDGGALEPDPLDERGTFDPEYEESSRRPRWLSGRSVVALIYVTAIFMTSMDNQIVVVVLPTLGRDFHSPLSSVEWTVLGYVLSVAIFIPASGWFGDRFGTKRVFIIAISTFTLASMLCGSAQNLAELVVARIFQGSGGGMILSVTTAMLYRAYPPKLRARMVRLLILPILTAPAIAPIVGGLFVVHLTWRWVFFINIPFGVFTVAVSAMYLKEHRQSPDSHFDLLGFVVGGGGLSAFFLALSEGTQKGWGSPLTVGIGAFAVIALSYFIHFERRLPGPLLNFRLLSDRMFRVANITAFLNYVGVLGSVYLVTQFLQDARNQNALNAGLMTFMFAIGIFVGSQTIGRLYSRLGPRRLCSIGALVTAASLYSYVFVGESTNSWIIRLLLFCVGLGNSMVYIGAQTSMFATITPADSGHASAIYASLRQSALACGVALTTAVVSSIHTTLFLAFHVAFVCAGSVCLLSGICAAWLIHDADAASTIVARAND